MKTYVRVQDGIVQEVIGPATDDAGDEVPIAQRFTAAVIAQLIDVTGVSPQPTGWWTYNGKAFAPPAAAPEPTAADLATAAMTSGLAVTSTATPALDGTYAIDQLSQAHIVAIETSLNAGKGFPGGSSTFNYPDMAGEMHGFTEATFTEFAAAVRDYVWALNSVIAGASSTLPEPSATIA